MILYLLLYTHLRVTESWRGHPSTIIWGGGGGGGGCCILGLNEPGVQLFLGYSDQGSINPRTEQPGVTDIYIYITTVVNLATCSVTQLIGRLSANFGN